LADIAVQDFRGRVQESLRPAAAYCLLTQATRDENRLMSFYRRAFSDAR
jgi:hypothetical protein